jgi:ribonuclease HI
MQFSLPQLHLYAEARPLPPDDYAWHFVLQSPDCALHLDVTDQEPGSPLERIELLAVVRGLEALDQPSRVSLVTPSRYVSHGLRFGLAEWRESGWLWESFGQMTPIKHEDLWRRIDQALEFHRVQCRTCRVDAAHSAVPEPTAVRRKSRSIPTRHEGGARIVLAKREKVSVADVRTPWLSLRQRVAGVLLGLGQAIAPEAATVG